MYKLMSIDRRFMLIAASLLCVMAFFGLSGRASATLEGENGPIVYVEDDVVEVECDDSYTNDVAVSADEEKEPKLCEEHVSQVVTTDSEGQDPEVVVEFEEEDDEIATTATISPNDEDGNHEVVVGTTARECSDYFPNWDVVDVRDVAVEEEVCFFYTAEAVIYRVVIDENREVVGDPEVVTVVEGEDGVLTYSNFYIELSYSPDGSSVVGTRFFSSAPIRDAMDKEAAVECLDEKCEEEFGPKMTIERVDLETGDVETLVDPVFDPFMNAGYAQDGTIYFTKTTFPERPDDESAVSAQNDEPEEEQRRRRPNSDVWYFAPGSDEAVQLTESRRINEYFLSVSPDNSQVLVCDPSKRRPRYYLVDTKTGELTIVQLDAGREKFLPLFFSPDGEGYLGLEASIRMYRNICGQRFEATMSLATAVETAQRRREPATAFAAALDFENAVVYNNMQNPDDWAPIVAFEETETPEEESQVLGASTTVTEKLESTGSNALFGVVAGSMVVTTAAGAAVRKEEE